MTDPKLGPLPADIARLIEAERQRPPDSAERAERILERVRATLVTPPPNDGGGGGGVLPALTKAKVGGALAAVFAAGALSGAAGHARFVATHRSVLSPPESNAAACVPGPKVAEPAATKTAEQVSAVPVQDSLSAPKPSAAFVAPASPAPSAAASSLMARDVDLAKERAFVDMARSALARGSTASAIGALRDHERTFPNGRLREERDAMLIQVLAQSGEGAEASRKAVQFRKQFPNSMLVPAVEAAIAKMQPDAPP